MSISIQQQLASAILNLYKNAEVKKIDKDNFLDIHLPSLNLKKGTHLFFNTAKEKIKVGFYCRDEEFNAEVLSKSDNLEKYAQGIRLKGNPEFSDTELAIEQAVEFINSILKGAKFSGSYIKQKDSKFSKFFGRIKAAYGKCSIAEEKNYASFTFKAAFLYELRVQKDIIRLLAANYPKKASIERSLEVIAKHEISLKLIDNHFEIIVEEGKVSPDKLTVRIEIPYKLEDMESDSFINKVIALCEEFHSTLMPLINEFQPEPVGTLKEIMGGEKGVESSPIDKDPLTPSSSENFSEQNTLQIPDQIEENKLSDGEEEEDNEYDDVIGLPMLRYRNQPEELKDIVNTYLDKWQKPSYIYAWRMGIIAYIPDFVKDLISEDICPIFTNEQIDIIYNRINNEKVIPILSYAPSALFFHTKHVWWIVPFCIWKEDVASMVFVDKNGFHALLEYNDQVEIRIIFSWENVDKIEYETAADDDPYVSRLTLYQEDGSYLTFDEFTDPMGNAGERGSYLRVIEAIWNARRETIEASRGKSFWLEGEGGETFEIYEHPSELFKSNETRITEIKTKVRTLIEFYIDRLSLINESSKSLEYHIKSDDSKSTTYIIEIDNTKKIHIYFKTTKEAYLNNAQQDGFLTKNFELKNGLLKLKGEPSFSDPLEAVQSFLDAVNFLRTNGNITEINSETAYYIKKGYYGDHPFEKIKYDPVIQSIQSAKEILLLRGDDSKTYLKILAEVKKNAVNILDLVIDLIGDEIKFRQDQNIQKVSISELKNLLFEKLEKNEIDFHLYSKILLSIEFKYQQVKDIQSLSDLRNYLEAHKDNINNKIVYLGLPESLQKDSEILEYFLSTTQKIFSFFPQEIKRNKSFILNWITKTKLALANAEDRKAADPENESVLSAYNSANTAAGLAPYILAEMDESLIQDEEILKAALSSKYVSFIEKLDPLKWGIDKEWAVIAAKINLHSVYYLPHPLKNDVDTCKALLNVNLSTYNFFTEEMKRNIKVQTFALKKDGYVFRIFPDDLRSNKKFIKSILEDCYESDDNRGYMVFAASNELSKDQELIDLAVERNPAIFKKLFEPSHYTKEIFKHYLKVTPYLFKLIPENLKNDRDLIISLLSGGFDGDKRESLFKESPLYNDDSFAMLVVQKSDYPYTINYLREDFQSKTEIVNIFLLKFPNPQHVKILSARNLGINFFIPLVNNNPETLFYINDRNIAYQLFVDHKSFILEKIQICDLKFFENLGALNGISDVYRAFLKNPLISSDQLEYPGYYIEQDEVLMKEISNLLIHLRKPFFYDRYNKEVDNNGQTFKEKNIARFEYITSLNEIDEGLCTILLSDPYEQIRELAASKITLDKFSLINFIKNGVPTVINPRYGESVIKNQIDYYSLKGFEKNNEFQNLPKEIKDLHNAQLTENEPKEKFIRVKLIGQGSEFIQGLISEEEFDEYVAFEKDLQRLYRVDSWILFLNKRKGKDYWEYNDVSHFTGIEYGNTFSIEIIDEENQPILKYDSEAFLEEFEESIEDFSKNDSERFGKWVVGETEDHLVTYQSIENMVMDFKIPTDQKFDPSLLGFITVSTDEMGLGSDYGDFILGITYDGMDYEYENLDTKPKQQHIDFNRN